MMAFVFAVVMNFASYWFSDKIVLTMYRAQPVGPEHPLYQIGRAAGPAGRPADAEGLHHPRPVAQRVRDRAQPVARGRGGHRGHPAPARRARTRGRHRPRARAREAPRHPDQLGGGDDGGRHHDGGAHGAVRGVLRRRPARRPRRRGEPDRAARHGDPGAARGHADPGGHLAVARVRRRRGRRARSPARPYGLVGRAQEDRVAVEAHPAWTPTPRRRTCSSSSRSACTGCCRSSARIRRPSPASAPCSGRRRTRDSGFGARLGTAEPATRAESRLQSR